MEKWFKDQTDRLKNSEISDFSEAILPDAYWCEKAPPVKNADELTEKKLVVDSFVQFSKEKIAENLGQSFTSNNIEIKTKTNVLSGSFELPSLAQWKSEASSIYSKEALDVLLLSITNSPLVVFLNDEFQDTSLVKSDSWQEKIFPASVASLFSKMIGAMKLIGNEQITFAIKPANFEGDEVLLKRLVNQYIYLSKPRFVLTLGAWSTNFILNKQERLANVHGQLFDLQLADRKTQVSPMFHPSVLEANQNTKKTAWTDMQKIMKILGKI
jgi:hypothetical protein